MASTCHTNGTIEDKSIAKNCMLNKHDPNLFPFDLLQFCCWSQFCRWSLPQSLTRTCINFDYQRKKISKWAK